MVEKNLENICNNKKRAERNLDILIKGFPLRDYIRVPEDCYDCNGFEKDKYCKDFKK